MDTAKFTMGQKFMSKCGQMFSVESIFVTSNKVVMYCMRSRQGHNFYWSEKHLLERITMNDIFIM